MLVSSGRAAVRMTTTAAAVAVADEARRAQRLEDRLQMERDELTTRTVTSIAQDAMILGFFEGLSLGVELGIEQGARRDLYGLLETK